MLHIYLCIHVCVHVCVCVCVCVCACICVCVCVCVFNQPFRRGPHIIQGSLLDGEQPSYIQTFPSKPFVVQTFKESACLTIWTHPFLETLTVTLYMYIQKYRDFPLIVEKHMCLHKYCRYSWQLEIVNLLSDCYCKNSISQYAEQYLLV